MDLIVVKLLEYLTPSEGPGSGFNTGHLHENEWDAIKAFFTVLREQEIPFNPAEIEEWLFNSQWGPNERVIKKVMKIVQDINKGKRKRIRDRELWTEEAKKG